MLPERPTRMDVPNQRVDNGEATLKSDDDSSFQWTVGTILQSLFVFLLAGVAEVVGGWLVWVTTRGNVPSGKKPWWYGTPSWEVVC
jgi:hypothetical protein